jgi:hypothetical protein
MGDQRSMTYENEWPSTLHISPPSLGLFAVERLAGADFIGYCGLIAGQTSTEEPEIAYQFARRIHGNGYATEAARIVVAEAAATGRSRLWATVREMEHPLASSAREGGIARQRPHHSRSRSRRHHLDDPGPDERHTLTRSRLRLLAR